MMVIFLKINFLPSSSFDGKYPVLASHVNVVVTDIILWKEMAETKDPLFRILKYVCVG